MLTAGASTVVVVAAVVVGMLGAMTLGAAVFGLADRNAGLLAVGAWLVVAEAIAIIALVHLALGADRRWFGVGRVPQRALDAVMDAMLIIVGVLVVGGLLVLGAGEDMSIGILPLVVAASWLSIASLALLGGRDTFVAGMTALSVIALALAAIGLPSTVRLKASEADIVAAAEQVRTGVTPDRVGLYGIVSAHVDHQGCVVLITQEDFDSWYGVAHCPVPPNGGGFLRHRFGEVYDYAYVG